MQPFFPDSTDFHTQPSFQRASEEASISPSIHWQQLYALADGDEEFALVLLRSFLNDGDRQLIGIRDALVQRDYRQAHHFAHQMKGASANVGVLEVEAIASQIEMQLKPVADSQVKGSSVVMSEWLDTDGMASLLTELEKAVNHVRAIVAERTDQCSDDEHKT